MKIMVWAIVLAALCLACLLAVRRRRPGRLKGFDFSRAKRFEGR